MTYNKMARLLSAAGLVILAACGDSPSESEPNLSDQEMLTLALSATSGAQSPGSSACPEGGDVTGTGSSNSSTSGDITALNFDLTVTFDSCAQPNPHGEGTVTLDGNAQYEGLIRVRSPQGGPTEILEALYHLTGSLHWQGDDFDLTCGINVTATFEPAESRYSVEGQICGRDVSHTVTY